jgi:predicted transposase/invertase (TIGR01784 family)
LATYLEALDLMHWRSQTGLQDTFAIPLIMLVGIPGSGKSTWAECFVQSHPRFQLVSTDAIRAALYGDEAIQGDWLQIWRQVLTQWRVGVEAIRQGQLDGLIYDATNTRRRNRRDVLAAARQVGFTHVTLCWFDVPLRIGLQRNRMRSRQVPQPVIETMYRQLRGAPPSWLENVEQIVRLAYGADPNTDRVQQIPPSTPPSPARICVMFDAVCKFLVETFSEDFARWLLGEAVSLTELSPSELLLEPIRADALLLQSERRVLHLEFQTQPDPCIPFRMLDYWVRLHRRLPEREIRQVVIYLVPSTSRHVYQTTFEQEGTRHHFEVIRLWEQPVEIFLNSSGLLPLAPLGRTDDRGVALQQVAARLETIPDRSIRSNLSASAAILAGLVLEKDLVQQILRSELMQESVIYQDILAEGLQQGLQQGEINIVLRQLNSRLGTITSEVETQLETLSLEQIEDLGEALLDFQTQADLMQWLAQNSQTEL